MKKILSCLLAVLLLASLSISAFAAEVPSVEGNKQTPNVVKAEDAEENDVSGWIIITPYEEKEKLPEEAQKQLDLAYETLQDVPAVVEGLEDLKALLDGAEVDCEALFDISVDTEKAELPVDLKVELVKAEDEEGEEKADKEDLGIGLKLELPNPDNFAALLHFVDGEATLVEAELVDGFLSFELEETGAYAILAFVDAE